MFIHLHNHSDYSLLDGLCRVPLLIETALEQGANAIALTDHGNLFGALEFYTLARKKGVKPIIGCEFYVADKSRHIKKSERNGGGGGETRYHLLLLAKNYDGYRSLCYLSSESYITGFYYKPRIDKELIRQYSTGLICLSGCQQGEIPQQILNGHPEDAMETARFYQSLFGDDFYLEIMRHGLKEEEKYIPVMAQIGWELGIKLVATNDAHYIKKSHAAAHDLHLCIGTQSKVDEQDRMRFPTPEFYLKTPEEMAANFSDHPEALSTTLEIADKCDLEIKLGEPHYPRFELPEGEDSDAESYLRKIAAKGFKERYGDNPPPEPVRRLENELNVIAKTGFANYFLVVWDFVRWAKEHNIPVGPGRGSAAGSTVSYALGITNLDPSRYGLIFERFLNPERISPPDIDIDFSDERREEVITYVREKYGAESVCRITTFGKMAAKSVVRDVARVLNLSVPEADKLARLIPEGPKVKLEESFKEVAELRALVESDERYARVWENALVMEGATRQSGTHAAGVVICPGRTLDFIPVYKVGGEGEEYTQFDMNWVDKLGLLKMDFLGLQTLSELDFTLKSLKRKGVAVDLDKLDLTDEKTLKLFGDGATTGVFQFESSGMKDSLSKLKPDRIEDVMAMAALYRPGPMANIPTYIACRHGRQTPVYAHPRLEPILKETYGVIIYQEQVIRIATDLAGFSLGKADILRKAMGKKDEPEMARLRPDFLDGCENNAIDRGVAENIWDDCKEFANYGFVKAHAAGYALIAFQCAYLKAHYPADYLASCLTVRRRNPNMVMKLLSECRQLGISVLAPDINESEHGFVATRKGIRFGLSAVKNVGDAAVEKILEARAQQGPFTSVHHFLTSADLRAVNKRVLEGLIDGGAFDSMGINRATLLNSLKSYMAYAQAIQDERERGQTTLFGGFGVDPAVHLPPPELKRMDEWPPDILQSREKSVLGFYITSHPLEQFCAEVEGLSTHKLSDKDEFANNMHIRVCGVVTNVQHKVTRKGEPMLIVAIEDLTGMIECLVFSPLAVDLREALQVDKVVGLSGHISKRDKEDEPTIMVDSAVPLAQACQRWGSALHLLVARDHVNEPLINRLEQAFVTFPGNCAVYINLSYLNGDVKPMRVQNFKVNPEPRLLQRLTELLGADRVQVQF